MTLEKMLTSKEVASRIGITTMTIERWMRDPTVEFPKPRQVKRLRFWSESEIASWLDGQRVH